MADSGARESSFTNKDGKKIYCHYWCEDLKSPRALVLINHGVAEHCLWYTCLALELKAAGFYVFAHDHVGHGQSEGDRVHVEDFHEYVRDSFQHYESVAENFPDLPKFVIGHSMGGAVTLVSAIERPDYFDGVILIAPAVQIDPETVSPLRIFLGKIVARICPQAPVLKLDTNNTSRDPAVITKYNDDPLVYHGGLKARWGASMLHWLEWIQSNIGSLKCPFMTIWGASMLHWLEWIQSNVGSLKCPFMTMHGTADKMTVPDGSRFLVEKASSADKTLKMYEGYYHQLHSEPGEDGAGVRREIVQWISDRVKQ
ncbi:hypothetical protein ACOMHN_018654 [Nucella lapillus]